MDPESANIIDKSKTEETSLGKDEGTDSSDILRVPTTNLKDNRETEPKKNQIDLSTCFSGDWSDFNPTRTFSRKVDTW